VGLHEAVAQAALAVAAQAQAANSHARLLAAHDLVRVVLGHPWEAHEGVGFEREQRRKTKEAIV